MGRPRKGDPIWVYWRDITADSIGDPNDARCWKARTLCIFVKWRGNDLIVSGTQGLEDGDFYGWDIFPKGVIKKIKRI